MNTHQVHRRVQTCIWSAALLCCTVQATTASAQNRTIEFTCDGQAQESKYLHEDRARVLILDGRPARNMDHDGHAIWRFDMVDVTAATLRIEMLNSFAVSIGSDRQPLRQVKREKGQGGRNYAWHEFDLGPWLPARYIDIRIGHGAQKEFNGGFGACVFAIRIEVEDDRQRPVALAAQV